MAFAAESLPPTKTRGWYIDVDTSADFLEGIDEVGMYEKPTRSSGQAPCAEPPDPVCPNAFAGGPSLPSSVCSSNPTPNVYGKPVTAQTPRDSSVRPRRIVSGRRTVSSRP